MRDSSRSARSMCHLFAFGIASCPSGIVATLGAIALLVGCATSEPYKYGRRDESLVPYQGTPQSMTDGSKDHPKLDSVERNLFAPFEAVRSAFRGANAPPPVPLEVGRQEAINEAVTYLSRNNLNDIHLAVRDYSPSDQWRRLRANSDIHPFWKYTDGSLRVLVSTVLPERVFRADRYNPHTKTLHLNSANPAKAVYAAATAKEYLGSSLPGTYAASQYLPIVPIYLNSQTASDSINYAKGERDWDLERQMYPTAYSRVGGSVLSEAYSVAPGASGMPFFVAPAVTIAGRVIGRGVGQWQASEREKELLQR